MPAPLFIGIDTGGSKTEVLALAGEASVHHVGPGANLQRDGADHTARVLADAIAETLIAMKPAAVGGICVGVAGAGHPADREDLAARLRDRLDVAAPLVVEHDGMIALEAAFEDGGGMIVVAGTGSVVMARANDGALLRSGGWGPRIGDEGSGSAIGTAALNAVAADFDGGDPTVLRRHLAEHHGVETPEDLIRAVYVGGWKVQELAPHVVAAAEAGDWVSTRILKTQANALAQRAGWLATRAQDALPPRLALFGGLADEAYYRACLTEALLRYLPRWRVVRPSRRPVHGALALARRAVTQVPHEMDSGG